MTWLFVVSGLVSEGTDGLLVVVKVVDCVVDLTDVPFVTVVVNSLDTELSSWCPVMAVVVRNVVVTEVVGWVVVVVVVEVVLVTEND